MAMMMMAAPRGLDAIEPLPDMQLVRAGAVGRGRGTGAQSGVWAQKSARSVGCQRMELAGRETLGAGDGGSFGAGERLVQRDIGLDRPVVMETPVVTHVVVERGGAEGLNRPGDAWSDRHRQGLIVLGVAFLVGVAPASASTCRRGRRSRAAPI